MPGKAKDYPTTIKRLVIILSRLYMGELLSVKELAEEFGISERTVQRYFNDYLKGAVPLKKVGRRWALESVAGALVDEESEIALQTIEEMAKEIGSDFYNKIKPLLSRLHHCSFNPFYTKLDIEDISDRFDDIAVLERVIKERLVTQATYKTDNGEIHIDIRPLRIANFEGYWYLIAADHRNGAIKKYYLKHLHDIHPTQERFEIPQELEARIKNAINVWFDPMGETFEVVLYADPTAAKYVKRLPISPTQSISGEDDDGGLELRLRITHEMELVPYIKKWIPHIVVMEPKWLADKIKEDVKTYLGLIKSI